MPTSQAYGGIGVSHWASVPPYLAVLSSATTNDYLPINAPLTRLDSLSRSLLPSDEETVAVVSARLVTRRRGDMVRVNR